MPIQNLLFIDTNIWLDFYRARNESGLKLLKHAEGLSDRLVVTYQLESEFKKNRQTAIYEGMQELKAPQQVPRLGIFSDAKTAARMQRHLKATAKRIDSLKRRLRRVLEKPADHDPVYQACQRIFHKEDDLNLTRDNPGRRAIRNKALRRFLHGCPPRKKNDTSIGDAINWEWMIHCAVQKRAGIVIVTRDADYGVTIDNKSYVNDHLKQEFSDRVSRKRKLLLYNRLSDALRLFKVEVSAQEEESENQLVIDVADRISPDTAPLSTLTRILSSGLPASGALEITTLSQLLRSEESGRN
jgi:hypothetical protein